MKCKVCGKELKFIVYRHLQKHGITAKEYKRKFGVEKLADEEVREKMAEKWKNQKNPAYRLKNRKRMMGQSNPAKRLEVRRKISEHLKGNMKNPMKRPEIAKKHSDTLRRKYMEKGNPFYGKHHTEKAKDHISRARKENWKDDHYIKQQMKARHVKPNKQELELLSTLKTISPNWKYVGDGRLIIGGKCPDFSDGNSNLIEYFGDYWHDLEEEQERIRHFKKYGYDCLVIWGHELNDGEKVIDKVLDRRD